MNLTQANIEMFNTEAIEVSDERWKKYIKMMMDCGCIKGVEAKTYISGHTVIDCSNAQITFKELDYL